MSQVVHVFYDVYLGFSYDSLTEVMRRSAKKARLTGGEAAVFLNKAWTACKILYPDGLLLYFRPGREITVEEIRSLPNRIASGRFKFSGALEASLIKASEKVSGKKPERLKVVYA
jgi:hypothetical protein